MLLYLPNVNDMKFWVVLLLCINSVVSKVYWTQCELEDTSVDSFILYFKLTITGFETWRIYSEFWAFSSHANETTNIMSKFSTGKILQSSFRETCTFLPCLQDSYKAHRALKLCEGWNDCSKAILPIPTASSLRQFRTQFCKRGLKPHLHFFDSALWVTTYQL